MKYPRSPKEQVGGIVYFGRLADKIRLMAAGELHPDLHANLGKGFDERCVSFLEVGYEALRARALDGLEPVDVVYRRIEDAGVDPLDAHMAGANGVPAITWAAQVGGVALGTNTWFITLSFAVSRGYGRLNEKALVRMQHLSGVVLIAFALVQIVLKMAGFKL